MDLEAEAGPSFTQDTWKVVAGANGDRVERPGSSSVTPRVDTVETSTPLSEQTDLKLLDVINELDDLKLSNGSSSRFHGQSSVIDFIQGTLNAGGSSASGTRGSAVRAKFWLPTAVSHGIVIRYGLSAEFRFCSGRSRDSSLPVLRSLR